MRVECLAGGNVSMMLREGPAFGTFTHQHQHLQRTCSMDLTWYVRARRGLFFCV
eukprot:COSAG05_NODE_980_length_6311_cov_21.873632_4_plen_54_part_00